MDEGKIISLRMGTEELQTMDDYLQQHPEMGGRSLFIRSAIRAYVDRDADVAQTHKNEVAVTGLLDDRKMIRFNGSVQKVSQRVLNHIFRENPY